MVANNDTSDQMQMAAASSLKIKVLELANEPKHKPSDAAFSFRPRVVPRPSWYKRSKPWTADSAPRMRPIAPVENKRVVKRLSDVVRQSTAAPENTRTATAASCGSLPPQGPVQLVSLPTMSEVDKTGGSANEDDECSSLSSMNDQPFGVSTHHMQPDAQEVPLDLKIMYGGDKEWRQAKIGSRHFGPYSKCVGAIVTREHTLDLLRNAVSYLDHRYFLYATHKLGLVSAGVVDGLDGTNWYQSQLSSNEEQAIKNLQNDLKQLLQSIIFATVEVVDSIRSYRALPDVRVYRQEPQFVWKGQNYLLQMAKDLDFLGGSHAVRLWLGTYPPGYVASAVDSSTQYNLGSNPLLYIWPISSVEAAFKLRDEQKRRVTAWKDVVTCTHKAAIQRASMMSLTDGNAVQISRRWRKAAFSYPPKESFCRRSTSITMSPSVSPSVRPLSSGRSQTSHSSSGESSSSNTSLAAALLRKKCLESWNDESPTWQDIHENAVFMEAASGFDALQPNMPLRPRPSAASHHKYQSILRYIEREQVMTSKIAQEAEHRTALRLRLQTYESRSAVASMKDLACRERVTQLALRRSTPAHHHLLLDGRRSVSAPQASPSSTLDGKAFFATAVDVPTARALNNTRNQPPVHHRQRAASSGLVVRPFQRAAGHRSSDMMTQQYSISVIDFCTHIEMTDAAIKLQRLIRMWLAKARVYRIRTWNKQTAAAIWIQALVRGGMVRRRRRIERRQLQYAALTIRNQWKRRLRASQLVAQAIVKFQNDRKKKVKLHRLVETATQGPRRVMRNAAIDIQRVYRGHIARHRVKQLRIRRRLHSAACKITKAAHLWLERREKARRSAHFTRHASKHRALLLRGRRSSVKKGSLIQPD